IRDRAKYKTFTLTLLALPLHSHAEPAHFSPALNPPFIKQAETIKGNPQAEIATVGAPTNEWLFHKTNDGLHPSGEEQTQLWLLNRARQNPTDEGIWLATSPLSDIADGRNFFNVDVTMLQEEFASYQAKPPAAFDVRLYRAAHDHSLDLISRDAQDHIGQFTRVTAEGFSFSSARGNVFSYASSGLNAHAAYNIDWGAGLGNMQNGRGHRQAIQSLDGNYSNVGIASVHETNSSTTVGPWVTTGNFASAQPNNQNHYNRFLVGTVWEDKNDNDLYDPGEGISDVTVMPDSGIYFAKTSAGGGYAIPITQAGTYQVTFSGGELGQNINRTVIINESSVLLDYKKDACGTTYTLPNNQWRQIGLLCNPDNAATTAADIFGDDGLGTYGTSWKLWAYNPITNSYDNVGLNGVVELGVGYWIIQNTGEEKTLDMPTGSIPATVSQPTGCPTGKNCFTIPLHTQNGGNQWNMVAYPHTVASSLGEARVVANSTNCNTPACTLDVAETDNIVHNILFTYNGTSYTQVTMGDNLNPWEGYWVSTLLGSHGATPVKLLLPKP
ncbi:MAG: hypothetical protein KAH20_14665, partial [Methylococcales bacterium]|nr:hypothetical protein [Methylococcales bacterium]